MTFAKRFGLNNQATIESVRNMLNISKLTEDASTVGMYIDMAALLKDYEQSQIGYLAVHKIYKSIPEDGSPFFLNAAWKDGEKETYNNQVQYICEQLKNLKTDFIICGCSAASYINLSQNFKRSDDPINGIYRIGYFDNNIEIYRAPPNVIPSDEFIYYDLDLDVFKKGKIVNLKQ